MKDGAEKPFKIIVFGEGGVGKSALTIRYVRQEFSHSYEPTIEDLYPTSVRVDGELVEVEVVDTAGSDFFSQMKEPYIRSGDGFLLIYSITDRWSFHAVSSFHEQIVTARRGSGGGVIPFIPLVIVGNKCDLDQERTVSYQEGDRLAMKFSCPFFETSAKDDIGVLDLFTEITRRIKKSKLRNHFTRDRNRFSLRKLAVGERKCNEKLRALRTSEESGGLRRSRSFRGFICGISQHTN